MSGRVRWAALRRSLVYLSLLALAECRREAAPRPAEPATAASSPAAPASPVPVRVSGLEVRAGPYPGEPHWGFTELTVDLNYLRLEARLAPSGAPLEKLLPEGALAIVNGGYFEADFRPSLWLRSRGEDLAPRVARSEGGVLATRGAAAYVGPIATLPFEPDFAVQSFPLILERDGAPGIRRDDGKRAARMIACSTDEGRLRFVLVTAPRGEGPTLFECMGTLRALRPEGFGCRAALNLDGGPSAGIHFADDAGARSRPGLAHVAYGIALLR